MCISVLHWTERWGKKEEWKKVGKQKPQHLGFSFPKYTCPLSRCIQNLKTLTLIGAKKYLTENLIGEKEKWTNKGKISRRRLILFYTIQVILNICIKFQNPRHSNSWEIFWHKLYNIGLRDEKREKWKKAKINLSIFFLFSSILGHSQGVYKIWRLVLIGVEKSVIENSIWEKEKWTNKRKDKQEETDSLLHNTTNIVNVCIEFQNPRNSMRNLWCKFPLCFTLEWEMEKCNKNKSQHLGFLSHNTLGPAQGAKFEDWVY